jgi:hypothetical protein
MTLSIRTTIRALFAPRHQISCRGKFWSEVLDQLERRGEGRHESGVFLLGGANRGRFEVKDAIYYDELDPNAYSTGVCVLYGDAFAKLWAICRVQRLTVVGDIHTHRFEARQSREDRTNPMVARSGHLAIIVPRYARPPLVKSDFGIYEYLGEHTWKHYEGKQAKQIIYTGFWA